MDVTPIFLTVLSTIITSVIGFMMKKINDKMEAAERRRAEEKVREEREREQREKEQQALRSGLRSMLRNSILHGCMKYIECGSKPMYEINNIGSMYDSYHALGGNGSVTRMYKLFVDLPVRESMEHEKCAE